MAWREMQAYMDLLSSLTLWRLQAQQMYLTNFTLEDAFPADGVVSGLGVTDAGGLDVSVAAGAAIVDSTHFSVGAGSLTLADDATVYVFVDHTGALASDTTDPAEADGGALLAVVTTASGDITNIDTSGRVDQSAWDNANTRLSGVASGTRKWHTSPLAVYGGLQPILAT